MDERLRNYLYSVAAGALTIAGLVTILVGYLGVRNEADIVLQLPYLASGGVGGLALIGLGAMALIRAQMQAQTMRFERLTDELEEWKESALTELREFLENAEIEVDLREVEPRTRPSRRKAG